MEHAFYNIVQLLQRRDGHYLGEDSGRLDCLTKHPKEALALATRSTLLGAKSTSRKKRPREEFSLTLGNTHTHTLAPAEQDRTHQPLDHSTCPPEQVPRSLNMYSQFPWSQHSHTFLSTYLPSFMDSSTLISSYLHIFPVKTWPPCKRMAFGQQKNNIINKYIVFDELNV